MEEAREQPVAGDPVAHGTFVGRERELAVLRGGLGSALKGQGQLFLLLGEPGVGKTRLAEELSSQARDKDALVLWGRCWEGGGAPPYWPWVQIIRAYAGQRDRESLAIDLGATGGYVAQVAPELRELVPRLGSAPAAEGEQARFALFDATATFLKRAARSRPLVLILDDIHAADEASLLMLEFVSRELRDAPILLLCTYRDVDARLNPELRQAIGTLAPEATQIPLRGLAPPDVGVVMERASGVAPSDALVAAVHAATGGNPFFVDELVHLMAAEGRLRDTEPPPGGFGLPEGVRQAIGRRLEGLSAAARRALTLGSVVGREFTLSVIAQASGRSPSELGDLLDDAVAAGIVTELSSAIGRYQFTHALIRETIYAALPSPQRGQLHQRVGEALEALYAQDPQPHLGELAHHFFEAAQGAGLEKAAEYGERAGQRAASQLAYEEAAGHYERVLECLDAARGAASEGRRCELLLALGDVRMKGGRTAGAREALGQAAELARRAGAPVQLAGAALALAAPYAEAGFGDPLRVVLLDEAMTALPEADSALRALVLARLAPELFWSHDFARADAVSAEAVEMARRLADEAALAETLDCRHYALMRPDTLEERRVLADELVRMADELGDTRLQLRGRLWRIHDLLEVGDISAVDADIAEHARLAETVRQPGHRWVAAYLRAMRTLLQGRLDEGNRQAAEAFAIGQRMQIADAAAIYYACAVYPTCRWRGGAEELEGPTRTIAERYRDLIPGFAVGVASFCELMDRREEARREYERFAGRQFDLPRDHNWLNLVCVLAELCAVFGDAPRAMLLYDLLRPYATRFVPIAFAAGCAGAAALALARLATTMTRYQEAEDHFETALELNGRIGACAYVAETEAEYAAMLLARGEPGDRDRARELLQAAQATAAELGLTRIAERCSQLGGAAGADLPAVTPAPLTETVFRSEGDYWTLSYRTPPFRLRDTKGLQLIALLLARPGDELPATELVAMLEGQARGDDRGDELGDAGEMLDDEAKRSYRDRLRTLEEEVEEATSFNDPEREARAREEIDFVTAELARAVGLGGRDRRAASASERARVSVTNRIRDAIEKIGREDPALAHHLQATIRTGRLCSYQPGPEPGVRWML